MPARPFVAIVASSLASIVHAETEDASRLDGMPWWALLLLGLLAIGLYAALRIRRD